MTGEDKEYLNVQELNVGRAAGAGASATNPTIAFGDGDTGFYEDGDDTIAITIAGTKFWQFTGTAFQTDSGARCALLRETASATNPNILPTKDDEDTGIGSAGADALSLIAGAIEGLRVEEGTNGTVKTHIFIPDLTTAPTGNPTAGGYLYVEAGALKYKGSSGTVTTLGNA